MRADWGSLSFDISLSIPFVCLHNYGQNVVITGMKLGAIRNRKTTDSKRCNKSSEVLNAEGNGGRQCNYGFVTFFGEAVRGMKALDGTASSTREVRKEIGLEF
ncbi:hypothetical protein CISIN_1g034156mg [Citrus sinensis]|uniref:Uncharacterized protein n=2 Tax=Citrus TaxID=2706 RepID=A0A067D060_CITSI|nr:hypothetical protein CISIN_1g034156mg [Citrus sinensis]